ncbi:MAG: hypothetical protein R2831_11125 [Chitinophagaceae bacterium]
MNKISLVSPIFSQVIKQWISVCILLFFFNMLHAQTTYSGTYAYSKGLNKAFATIVCSQFKADSAFVCINAVSGMPDFHTIFWKGFIHQDSSQWLAHTASCTYKMSFKKNILSIQLLDSNSAPFTWVGKYVKKNNLEKINSSMLEEMNEQTAICNADSVVALRVPHIEGRVLCMLNKNTKINIVDKYLNYYLVEVPSLKNDYVWIPKKYIKLLKNK